MKKKSTVTKTPFPVGLAQPALRALAGAGFKHLEQLVRVPESVVRNLHGIGPNGLEKLRSALTALGLSFAKDKSTGSDIDGYIALFPDEVQKVLKKVREVIRRAAPAAEEVISYRMPAFKQQGILVYYAGWTQHIGMYPPISGDKALEKALARYTGPKGNLQFPLDEPIPYDLIERIVKLRVKQNALKAEARRKKKSQSTPNGRGAP